MADADPHFCHATSVNQQPLSETIQDYLKGIYKLQAAGGRATVTALARDQGVSAASASAMLKKLAVLDLLELFLARTLGVAVDDVHDEADRLEHHISEELEERIDRALGFPTHDPHGDPIPDANLEWPTTERPSGKRH